MIYKKNKKKNKYLINNKVITVSKKINEDFYANLEENNIEDAITLVIEHRTNLANKTIKLFGIESIAILFLLVLVIIVPSLASVGLTLAYTLGGLLTVTLLPKIINNYKYKRIQKLLQQEKEIIDQYEEEKEKDNIIEFDQEKSSSYNNQKNNNYHFEEDKTQNNNQNEMGHLYNFDDFKKKKR